MYISSGIAFALFIMICIYHAFRQNHIRNVVTALIIKAKEKFCNKVINADHGEPNLDVPKDEITHTVVELSELLLDKEHS